LLLLGLLSLLLLLLLRGLLNLLRRGRLRRRLGRRGVSVVLGVLDVSILVCSGGSW